MKRSLNLIISNIVFHQVNVALKIKFNLVTSRHQNKSSNFPKQQKAKNMGLKTNYSKNTEETFSSYKYSTDESIALSYRFYHHIPRRFNGNTTHIKHEQF